MSWFIPFIILAVFSLFYFHKHSKCHFKRKCKRCDLCQCDEGKSAGSQRSVKQHEQDSSSSIITAVSGKGRCNQKPTRSTTELNIADSVSTCRSSHTLPPGIPTMVRIYPNERNLPIKSDKFRAYMAMCVEFAIEYLGRTESLHNVTHGMSPGFLMSKLPAQMPTEAEKLSSIFRDIFNDIMPGLTHWQHPRFMAYFPHGCSYPDTIAEFLISSIGVVQFSWDSSPAFTELEVVMVNWLGRAIGLPESHLFDLDSPKTGGGGGAIQNSSSDAIFIALLAAREQKLSQLVALSNTDSSGGEAEVPKEMSKRRERKLRAQFLPKLIAYASTEAHTSMEKAARLAMVRLRLVQSDARGMAMRGSELERLVRRDLERGYHPFFVLATAGTTPIASFDNFAEIGEVAAKYQLWTHVDGAYGLGAMICPEYRYLMAGIEQADSLNLNMHKLLLTSCTCSLLWTRNQQAIHKALKVNAVYLRSTKNENVDFRHWGIGLSRRAKALKLWLLFRLYGLQNLQDHVRRLCRHTEMLYARLLEYGRVVVVFHRLTLISFRVMAENRELGDRLTFALCQYINRTHKLLVTHARVHGRDIIRLCVCHERSSDEDVCKSWEILKTLMDEFFDSEYAKAPAEVDLSANDVYDVDANIIVSASTQTTASASTASANSSVVTAKRVNSTASIAKSESNSSQ